MGRDDLWSLALVPEAVAFALLAGVDPLIGLYAAFRAKQTQDVLDNPNPAI
jgi:hypothetical protein